MEEKKCNFLGNKLLTNWLAYLYGQIQILRPSSWAFYSPVQIRKPDSNKNILLHMYGPFYETSQLVHNGGSPKFEALYGSLNMGNSTGIS